MSRIAAGVGGGTGSPGDEVRQRPRLNLNLNSTAVRAFVREWSDPNRFFRPGSTRQIGAKEIGIGAGLVALAAVVSLLRQGGAGALDTIWAEDGTIFLNGAVNQGPVAAIGTSYAGYYHLMPRLVAGLVSLTSPHLAAVLMSVAAAVWCGLVALFAYVVSAPYLRTQLGRILVSAVVVVVPVAWGDLPNSIANLHWYGHYALFWALLWLPRGRAGKLLAAAIVVLVGGSDILVMAFVPLALYRALRRDSDGRRDRHGIVLLGLLLLTLAVQVSGLLTGASSRETSLDPEHPITGFVLRVVPGALVGSRWLGNRVTVAPLIFAVISWVLVGLAVMATRQRMSRPDWPVVVVAAVQGFLLYAVPVMSSARALERYAAVPGMLILVAMVAMLEPGEHRRREVPLYVLTGLLLVIWSVNYRVPNLRADGPRWSDELSQAQQYCRSHPGAGSAVVEFPPRNDVPPWLASLPCDYVLR